MANADALSHATTDKWAKNGYVCSRAPARGVVSKPAELTRLPIAGSE